MTVRVALLLTAVTLAAPWSPTKWAAAVLANGSEPAVGRIRIVPRNGPSYIGTLDGVGCTEALCSRVVVRTLALDDEGTPVQNIRFDTVAAIEMLAGGNARVRFVDGTFQRVLIAADNRVLYLFDQDGRTQTVGLDDLTAIEFLR